MVRKRDVSCNYALYRVNQHACAFTYQMKYNEHRVNQKGLVFFNKILLGDIIGPKFENQKKTCY